jgi:hypothetical protein
LITPTQPRDPSGSRHRLGAPIPLRALSFICRTTCLLGFRSSCRLCALLRFYQIVAATSHPAQGRPSQWPKPSIGNPVPSRFFAVSDCQGAIPTRGTSRLWVPKPLIQRLSGRHFFRATQGGV